MAKNGPQRNTVATIRDRKGNVILEVTQKEYVVKESDGPLTAYSEYENIILEDGLGWNPSMMGQKPPVRIAVCDICRKKRKPKTHGLVSVAGGRLCVCGKLCCPKHRRQSSRDHKWRCPTCHHRHIAKCILTPIFFKRKEATHEVYPNVTPKDPSIWSR